jgi:thioredoxin
MDKTMAVTEITIENFRNTIEQEGIVLLDFGAPWCGPCRKFEPIFEKASTKHQDVVFGVVDTEVQEEMAESIGIQAIPTLMLFRDGILLFREAGMLSAAGLDQLIQSAQALDMDRVKQEIAQEIMSKSPSSMLN